MNSKSICIAKMLLKITSVIFIVVLTIQCNNESDKAPVYDIHGKLIYGEEPSESEKEKQAVESFYTSNYIKNDTDELLFHVDKMLLDKFQEAPCYGSIGFNTFHKVSPYHINSIHSKHMLHGNFNPLCSNYLGKLSVEYAKKLKDFSEVSKAIIEYLNDPQFSPRNQNRNSINHVDRIKKAKDNSITRYDYMLLLFLLEMRNIDFINSYDTDVCESVSLAYRRTTGYYNSLFILRDSSDYYEKYKDALYLWDQNLDMQNFLNWYWVLSIYYQDLKSDNTYNQRLEWLLRKQELLDNNQK